MSEFKGQIVLITGAARGIGKSIAKRFALAGAHVIIADINEVEGDKSAEQITNEGYTAEFLKIDLAKIASVEAGIQHCFDQYGHLDVLVNNAGIFPRAKFEETTSEFWDTMFAVNTRSAFLCSQAAVPLMRARGGGSIINMGSTLPWSLGDNLFAYGCSKGAMYTMTRQLAGILRKDKIRANWVTIGWVLTEKEFEVQEGEGREEGWEVGQADQLPMGEFNTEGDMAEACVYLASDAAARVTGTDLNVSAGLNIHI